MATGHRVSAALASSADRASLQAIMSAMVDMDEQAETKLMEGLKGSFSESFKSVMKHLKQIVTAAQQRIFTKLNRDYSAAAGIFNSLTLDLPNPETDAAVFLAFLTDKKTDVAAFVRAKKNIDKVKDELKSLLLQWKAAEEWADEWD